MTMLKRNILLVATALAGFHVAQAATVPADTVYRNGYIYTVDARDSVQQALAVKGGRIAYVGSDDGVGAYISKRTKVVDLKGRMMMPGLVDGHMHPLAGGAQLLRCNLNYLPLTVPEFQARIQACLDKDGAQAADKPLVVVNWFQQDMRPAGTEATHATLDALKTRRAILVLSSFGHSTLANSRALQLAGIDRTTKDPVAGRINRDAAGDATGVLEDSAQELVAKLTPEPTARENAAAAKAALGALREQGVTSFLDAAADDAALRAFGTLQKQGGLTARAHFALLLPPAQASDPDKAVAALAAKARRYDQGPVRVAPTVAVRHAKLFMDGVIAAPALTGTMLKPYNVNQGSNTDPHWVAGTSKGPDVYFPQESLRAILSGLAKHGITPHIHVDGDGAVHETLDAIAYLRTTEYGRDVRPALAHNELVAPDDMPRFAELNATPVLSFQWEKPAPDTLSGLQGYLEPARYDIIEPAGYLEQAHARIAYGSDWPVDPLNEWFALKVGVTRTNSPEAGPQFAGKLGTDPGLSRATVLRAITFNAAYTLGQEKELGSLEAGKLADMIVLDKNFMTVESEDIAQIKVVQTVVGGRLVYNRE